MKIRNLLKSEKVRQIAVGAIVFGNVARFLGAVEPISRFIFQKMGFRPLEFVDANMRIIIPVVLLLGYGAAFYFIYRRYIARAKGIKRFAYSSVLGVLIVSVFALNVYALPKPPDPYRLLPKELNKWSETIYKSQLKNGSFTLQPLNPSSPPQVYTTAQSLKALITSQLGVAQHVTEIKAAFTYIESTRRPPPANPNDPDEGWGYFEGKKKSVTEITAWVALAYIASIESKAKIWQDAELPVVLNIVQRDLAHLRARQDQSGGWRPIIDEHADFTRSYSTAMALWALVEARKSRTVYQRIGSIYDTSMSNGITWLLKNHDKDLGWVPNPNRPKQREHYDGLNAQVLYVLSRAEADFGFLPADLRYLEAKRAFIMDRERAAGAKQMICSNNRVHDADLAFPPVDFELEGSTFLWFPWAFAELTFLSTDAALGVEERNDAFRMRTTMLRSNLDELVAFVDSEYMYVVAEHLFSLTAADTENIQR